MVITIMSSIGSCEVSTKEIARKSQSERADIFTEVSGEGTVPAGFGDLIIKASIKTPVEGWLATGLRQALTGCFLDCMTSRITRPQTYL